MTTMDYAKLIDKKANFVGKGIKVKNADPKWNWYLPDLDSSAQKVSENYVKTSRNTQAEFIRSFALDDDIGFVWRWMSDETEIYLLYVFLGENGYILRTLHNEHKLTIDEVILAVYFDDWRLEKFHIEKWTISQPETHYGLAALGFRDYNIFSKGDHFHYFKGRVATIQSANLIYRDNTVFACEDYFQDKCIPLPAEMENWVSQSGFDIDKINELGISAQIKFSMNSDGSVDTLLAGMIFEHEYLENIKVYSRWAIPSDRLGAGIDTGIVGYDRIL